MHRAGRTFIQVALLVLLALPAVAEERFQPWHGASILTDPVWRNHFLGSYGFLSGLEPAVQPQEIELLREVIDLMKVNPRAAASTLEEQGGEESSAALDFVLANLQFQNGRLAEAARSYESALHKFPDFRRAHKNLALLLVQRNRCEDALPHLSRASELGDRDGRTFGLMGYCYIAREDYLAAGLAYRNAVLQQPANRDWKLGLARALLATHHDRDAVALFDALLQADPLDARVWLLEANAYVALEQPMRAAVNLETVRMLGKSESDSLALLGDIYMNAGMYESAGDAYLEAIGGDDSPADFAIGYRAAKLLIRTGAHEEADTLLDAIEGRYGKTLDSDSQLGLLTLRAKLARAQGDAKRAAKLLLSIVGRDGTRGDALLELADYYVAEGDEERALVLLAQAEHLDAYAYRALLEHAKLLVRRGQYEKAVPLLQSALRIEQEPRVQGFLAKVEEAAARRATTAF